MVELDKLKPVDQMAGEDDEETELLNGMLTNAVQFIRSHDWCPDIVEKYFGFGVGGVVAVFLFKLKEKVNETDDYLWVVEGDLPSVYLVVDEARNPRAVLEIYCDLMDEWASAVIAGRSLDDVFPVEAEPTLENAEQLRSRIDFLKKEIIPSLET